MCVCLFITALQPSCGKVMFSVMSVCLPHQPHPLDIRHKIPSQPQSHPSLLMTSGSHHWRPVQACSLEDPQPPPRESPLVVSTETCTVCKRAVLILLSFFVQLVLGNSTWKNNTAIIIACNENSRTEVSLSSL